MSEQRRVQLGEGALRGSRSVGPDRDQGCEERRYFTRREQELALSVLGREPIAAAQASDDFYGYPRVPQSGDVALDGALTDPDQSSQLSGGCDLGMAGTQLLDDRMLALDQRQ